MANNNVISMVETGVPSSPDVAALNAMSDPLVMVHKMIPRGGNKREAQIVVNAKTGLKPKQILKLQDDVADTNKYPDGGPGLYRFEVTDQQSTAKTFWETRIGGQVNDETSGEVAAAGQASAAPAANLPPPTGAEHLGNGFYYNPRYHTLSTPDGRVMRWDPSMELPELNPGPRTTPPATPIGQALFASGAPDDRVKVLEAELARMRDEARDRRQQEELNRLREEHRQEIDAVTKRMETLIEKVTARPAEDPQVAELKRQLEEQRRQDALRSEFTSKIDSVMAAVRESQASRGPDPMIGVLTQILGEQRASAAESLRTMRELTTGQLTVAQQATMTPEKLLGFLQQMKDSGSSVINEKMVGIVSSLLETSLRFRQAEAQLGGGGGSTWMDVIERLADKAGGAFTALAQAKSREAAASTAKANEGTVRAQLQREREARMAAQRQSAEAPDAEASTEAPATAAADVPQDGEAQRDALAEKMFPKAVPAPAPAPTPIVEATPPAAEPLPIKIDKKNPLAKMPVKQLRGLYAHVPDETFFGPAAEMVDNLRKALQEDPNSVTADDLAGYVIEARPQLVQAVQGMKPEDIPLVVAMLAYGHFAYLFERMVPEMGEPYWRAAAVSLKAKVDAERAAAG